MSYLSLAIAQIQIPSFLDVDPDVDPVKRGRPLSSKKEIILEALPGMGKVTTKFVAAVLGSTPCCAYAHLHDLAESGVVMRHGGGRRGNPILWELVEK